MVTTTHKLLLSKSLNIVNLKIVEISGESASDFIIIDAKIVCGLKALPQPFLTKIVGSAHLWP